MDPWACQCEEQDVADKFSRIEADYEDVTDNPPKPKTPHHLNVQENAESEELPSAPRQCIACLVIKIKTKDVFDGIQICPEIKILLDHLHAPVRGNASDTGLCLDCLEQLQRWHMFYTTRRQILDMNPPKHPLKRRRGDV